MKLSSHIDWVIKKDLIETYMNKKNISWDNPKARMMDLQYHDLNPKKGLYFTLKDRGYVETLFTDEQIQNALSQPPQDTRAYFRAQCVKRFKPLVYAVSWTSVLFNAGEHTIKKVPIMDPTRGTKKLTETIFDSSSTPEELLDNISR